MAVLAAVISPILALAGLLALALFSIADALRLRGDLDVDVAMPSRLVRGASYDFVVEPKGIDALSRRCRVRQAMPPGVLITPSEAGGSLHASVTASRRGRVQFPPAAVRLDGPLHLMRRTWSYPNDQIVAVIPDVPAATRLARASRQRESVGQVGFTRGAIGLGTDFESVREYVEDDDFRRINWSATLRAGHPMTNEYRQDQDRQILCVVDCGRLMGAPVAGRSRLDAAVDAALAVAAVADAVGDRCGLVAFDDQIRQNLFPRRAGARAFLAAVSDLDVNYVQSQYDLVFTELAHRKRSLLVLFTDLFDEAAGSALLEALPVLTRRHAVLIASCFDDDLGQLAAAEATTAQEAYAAVVALGLIDAQTMLTMSLRRAGAETLALGPDDLSEGCVRRYLQMKARARL
ncbi:MAG TPA: DUF58 domain-containing protein [Acidimicrobiales bacterium]